MKIWVLSVAFALLAITGSGAVYAADSDDSTVQCGVQIGGFSLIYTANAKSEKKTDKKTDRKTESAFGLLGSDASGVATYMRADSKTKTKGSDRRLPRAFTFAQLGCSF